MRGNGSVSISTSSFCQVKWQMRMGLSAALFILRKVATSEVFDLINAVTYRLAACTVTATHRKVATSEVFDLINAVTYRLAACTITATHRRLLDHSEKWSHITLLHQQSPNCTSPVFSSNLMMLMPNNVIKM